MATRKIANDPVARDHAIERMSVALAQTNADIHDAAALFDGAEFETATSKVGGQEIQLRRVVLTGPWEVVSS